MKTRLTFTQLPIMLSLFTLVFYAFAIPARAAAVTPSVCFEMKKETTTRTLTSMTSGFDIRYDGPDLPWGFYLLVINPGGANEETLYVKHGTSSNVLSTGGLGRASIGNVHQPGEPLLISHDGQAVFGYNNTGSNTVGIPRGVSSQNYFSPGPLVYSAQPAFFLPGGHEDVMRLNVVLGHSVSWWLLGTEAEFSGRAENMCGTITYQGRLSDGANAANGQYDMRFQPYDAQTDGTAQGAAVNLDNVQVTNGVFTVQLKIGGSLTKNFIAKFLEIGVKPGNAPAADPYTILTPRQPITSVPYAINAQFAALAATAENAISANSANNATNLGGLPAASFLTTGGIGQSADTFSATGNLPISTATQTYTLIPGLTRTLNVSANSVLFISTDGGIQSNGLVGSHSVVDIAIFIDGVEASSRRVVVDNTIVALSVDNWSLTLAKALSPGSHTITVQAKGGTTGTSANLNSGGLTGGKLTVMVLRW